MKIIDPGHDFKFKRYDGAGFERLRFMKRFGGKYPGNNNNYPGTNMQEVMRGLISRTLYLDRQKQHWVNNLIVDHQRQSIVLLEVRAAGQHGRKFNLDHRYIEEVITCDLCGHIECRGDCTK